MHAWALKEQILYHSKTSHYLAVAKNGRIPVQIIYFDFSRAFDRTDFGVLLAKLSSLGLGTRIVDWCAKYLNDRPFSVLVNSTLSDTGRCASGLSYRALTVLYICQ